MGSNLNPLESCLNAVNGITVLLVAQGNLGALILSLSFPHTPHLRQSSVLLGPLASVDILHVMTSLSPAPILVPVTASSFFFLVAVHEIFIAPCGILLVAYEI